MHIVCEDRRQRGVFYIGGYPYDRAGSPLLDEAPMIVHIRDGLAPGLPMPRERAAELERKAYGSERNDNFNHRAWNVA